MLLVLISEFFFWTSGGLPKLKEVLVVDGYC